MKHLYKNLDEWAEARNRHGYHGTSNVKGTKVPEL